MRYCAFLEMRFPSENVISPALAVILFGSFSFESNMAVVSDNRKVLGRSLAQVNKQKASKSVTLQGLYDFVNV